MTEEKTNIAEPVSFNNQPWGTFPKLAYAFINDDFVHQNKVVMKVNLKNDKGGVIAKETVGFGSKTLSLTDQTKFWLSLPGKRSFSAQIKTGQTLRVYFDNGSQSIFGKTFNIYSALRSSRHLTNLSWRFGAFHQGQHYSTDNHIKFDQNHQSLQWYNRTLVSHDKFTFGILGTYDALNNIINKNNILLGYQLTDNISVFLRAQNQKLNISTRDFTKLSHLFNHITLDYIHKYDNNTTFGIEAALQLRKNPFKQVQLVVQRVNSDNWTFKAKATNNLDVTLLLKTPQLKSLNGKVSLGMQMSGIHRNTKHFSFGSKCQLNL